MHSMCIPILTLTACSDLIRVNYIKIINEMNIEVDYDIC